MEHWSSYWRAGHTLSSFAESDWAKGYNNKLVALWEPIWKTLPQNARILDVGTGNGALALAIAKYSSFNRKAFEINGIDVADIAPLDCYKNEAATFIHLKNINFISNCGIENTPFENQQFEAIFSQFGLEYSDWSLSLSEMYRITTEVGKIVAIIHTENSASSLDSLRGIDILTYCLFESKMMLLAKSVLERVEFLTFNGKAIKQDKTYQELNYELLNEVRHLQFKFSSEKDAIWFNDVITRVAPLMYELRTENVKILNMQYTQLELHLKRLIDQKNAMLSESKIEQLVSLAKLKGWQSKYKPVKIGGDLLGAQFEFNKI